MSKKIYVLSFFLPMMTSLMSCGGKTTGIQEPAYTSMEEIARFNEIDGDVLGISPDGAKLAVWENDRIKILNAGTLAAEREYDCPVSIYAKEAFWDSRSEKLILGDAYRYSNETMMSRINNLYVYGPGAAEQLTQEDEKGNYFRGARIFTAPSWSADGKSLIFSADSIEECSIIKLSMTDGKETVLFTAGEDLLYVEGIELKDGLLLVEYNWDGIAENDIFLYNIKSGEKRSLDDILDRDNSAAFYEIKGWSADRRTVLITKWLTYENLSGNTSSMIIRKCIVLSFDPNFREYTVKTISYGLKPGNDPSRTSMYNPDLMDPGNGNNRTGLGAVLSPGGRYVVTSERIYQEYDSGPVAVRLYSLTLHDLETGLEYILLKSAEESDVMFGFTSPLNGNRSSIFFTENGKLLVWFADGYRLFQLKS